MLGALIFSYTGAEPPKDARDWTFERATMRRKLTLKVRPSTHLRRLWISVCYFNRRGDIGPTSQPREIFLVPSNPGPVVSGLLAA